MKKETELLEKGRENSTSRKTWSGEHNSWFLEVQADQIVKYIVLPKKIFFFDCMFKISNTPEMTSSPNCHQQNNLSDLQTLNLSCLVPKKPSCLTNQIPVELVAS